ncbi:MAG: CRP-like cAMP-binding protein [Oleiphilaceae bacterium]|jgi:CRP-like cAMP-binding protein
MPSSIIPVSSIASAELVKQSPLFASLPNALLAEMAQHFQIQTWEKEDYISPNFLTERFCFLQTGQLEMKRSNPDTGREVTVDMLYPGDSFDIIALLDGQPHNVVLSPITSLRVISVPIALMRKWLWTYPELNQQFLPYLAQKMREQEDKTVDIALHDVSTRLSRIILKHLNKIQTYTGKKEEAPKNHLINHLSDEALARMSGSVRQIINKQLQHWKSQGVLDKKRNEIIIYDLDTIYEEANNIHKHCK